MTTSDVRRVAVIGAGTIGASWAAWFLARGLEVIVSDPLPTAAENVRRTIDAAWPVLMALGGPPNVDPKRWRFDKAMAFYRAIGKHPIEIRKEVPGHVSNRLQAALWREAVYLVQQGVASVADVDAAISEGPGLRWALMGPHMTFHLGGGVGGMAHFLDHLLPGVQGLWADLGTPDMTKDLRQRLIDGVAEEAGGHSVAELERWRDGLLVQLIELRQRAAANRTDKAPGEGS